ncbi:MAG: hypothetical protein C0410_01945 [Anaerolinea sp.]|nr:hypothetical protein [Anaerolinea sp.]
MYWLIRFLLCSLMLLPIGSVKAQSEEPVTNVQLDFQFGSSIHIDALVSNPADYSSILLILQPDGQSSRQIKINPAADGSVIVDYDLTLDPLRPFARVYYWFDLTALDGSSITTSSYWFDYLDDRFQWDSSETDLFQINWVNGSDAFGQKVQEIARDGLKASTNLLPVTPDFPIHIYIYPDVDTLQEALTLTGQPWIAGHASTDIGVLLVSNGSQSAELIEMERQIPHEMMHVLEYKLAGESYSNIPAWLNEGLATSAELYPDPDLQRVLNESQVSGSLLSISSLCDGFPQDAKTAQLAYAQSTSFVNYLNGRFGSQIFSKLIENAASGQTCESAINSAVSVSLADLEKDWLAVTFIISTPVNFGILAIVIAVGVLIVVMMIMLLCKRHYIERKTND